MKSKEMTPQEKWENATLANNFIFYKVMHNNPDVCKEFIERLLQIEIDHIEMAQEEEIDVDPDSKSIRMDVYAKNETESFDVEMQAIDTKELPERARYYQGLMDVDNLKSGEQYINLKTSYVIFICITDIFDKGLPKYTFENLCVDNPKIKLNDRTYKYFFIANNCDKLSDGRQKELLNLVLKNEGSDVFSKKILSLVDNAKKNSQWRQKYMEYERQRAYDMAAGEEKGIKENKIENAKAFLAIGKLTVEEIASCIKLPIEEVQKLAEEINIMRNA